MHRCITRISLDKDEITVSLLRRSIRAGICEVSFQEKWSVSVGWINITKLWLTVMHITAAALVRQEVFFSQVGCQIRSFLQEKHGHVNSYMTVDWTGWFKWLSVHSTQSYKSLHSEKKQQKSTCSSSRGCAVCSPAHQHKLEWISIYFLVSVVI